jgi:phage FluMu protein Com
MGVEVKCKIDNKKLFELNGDMIEILCPKEKRIIKIPLRKLLEASTSTSSELKEKVLKF